MSVPSRGLPSGGAASNRLPTIEIGSFVALPSNDSEFIGSASGVFFADTVFRAFAMAASAAAGDASEPQRDSSAGVGPAANVATDAEGPDPGSAHTYLVAPETNDELPSAGNDSRAKPAESASSTSPGTPSYGVDAPALGIAPPADKAQKLLMNFFRHWHPFFPFLHGPTFVEQVNHFYGDDPDLPLNRQPNWKLCRAVMFQSIFNIAASTSARDGLEPACRIQSAQAFVSVIGNLFSSHDAVSLQALLAAELYLISTMSLRAASTIQGALARSMHNSGFHRCPSRYHQLPLSTYGIRKRIFWCAYVLDRYIGQALGHPFSIQDADVDVCIPGMIELHRPVKAKENAVTSQAALNEQVLGHLPVNQAETGYLAGNPSAHPEPGSRPSEVLTTQDILAAQSPSKHYTAAGKEAREFILSHLATYSQMLGEVVHLFHRSIHTRNISSQSIRDITYRIHCWWNGLPPTFQDEVRDGSPDRQPSHSVFFNMLHNYLILLIHRPFLSLPPDNQDFQSSVQMALSASRNIIVKLKWHTDNVFLMAWPATLSAVWMAGLVIAFASLLELYPNAKANSDLGHCLAILESMASRWASARHCREAIKSLLQRLNDRFGPSLVDLGPTIYPSRLPYHASIQTMDMDPASTAIPEGRSAKRQRLYNEMTAWHQGPLQYTAANIVADEDPFGAEDWMPVMEYTGPDFGFDAAHIDRQGLFSGAQDTEMGSLFSSIGWDASLQGPGGRFGA
ncbi:fungal-specific transcription factor [Dactylonectria macrodidyma]|uniref:Fungal-specific transcription factor n=1 Tax=Dactylonectria macrodidyma TaxID=307937 RepID=A0A9P9INW4_9HYPO|nr:fungal-specific transcription factor [Dactylonectria macrodidyma]